jgi:predicted class III extradiol MEMO1 family dioxygenase
MLFGSIFISMTVAHSCAMALKLHVPEEVLTQQLAMFVPHAEYMVPAVMARDYSQVNASVDRFKDVCELRFV